MAELSFAEVVRRGVEYFALAYPSLEGNTLKVWHPPKPARMGRSRAPAEDWRSLANE